MCPHDPTSTFHELSVLDVCILMELFSYHISNAHAIWESISKKFFTKQKQWKSVRVLELVPAFDNVRICSYCSRLEKQGITGAKAFMESKVTRHYMAFDK